MTPVPIKIERCWFTEVGLELPQDMELSEWKEKGRQLLKIGDAYQWYVGDWLNFGERKYGDKYKIACEELGIKYSTLTKWASVCNRLEFCRRRQELGFSHHLEIVNTFESPKDQNKWLQRAIENKWSIEDLREKLRENGAQYADEDHGSPVKNFAVWASNLVRVCNKQLDQVDTWAPEVREQHAEMLRPIAEFYHKLKEVA